MATKLPFILLQLSLFILFAFTNANANANAEADRYPMSTQQTNETQLWKFQTQFNPEEEVDENVEEIGLHRRSLYWWSSPSPKRYYISYGALSANRVPCPPRSGRSYYTHNCYGARGAVRPYTRGCSAITRCRR